MKLFASAPIPTFPRKQGKECTAPSLAERAGEGQGGGSRLQLAGTLTATALLFSSITTVVAANDSPLPHIGVALTFIYTTCKDTCPVLTAKLVEEQAPP